MKDDVADLGKIEELLMTYDLSDEVLEAAARVDGGRAITFGYCATASSAWYCLPYEQATIQAAKRAASNIEGRSEAAEFGEPRRLSVSVNVCASEMKEAAN